MAMDVEWALGELRAFERMTVMRNGSGRGVITMADFTAEPDETVTRAAPVIEKILDRVIPDWHTSVPLRSTNRWTRHRDAVMRAITILEREEELSEKLGENAPTLNAGHLHPWVWEGARSMWQSGHFRQAVVDAAKRINAEAQNKIGTRVLSETDLTNQAFSDDPPKPGRPRLRLPEDDDGKTARSIRRGIRAYAEGCFAALRNPAAHDDLDEVAQDEALEQLAAFSVLARWIDRAQPVTAP